MKHNSVMINLRPPLANLQSCIRNLAAGGSPLRLISWAVMALTLVAAISWAGASLWAQSTGTTFVVNTTSDEDRADIFSDACDVDSTEDGDQCSLRAAIDLVNRADPADGPFAIHFNIPGDGPHVISPASNYYRILVPVTIDGSTQPGASCPTADQPANLKIVLDGVDNERTNFNVPTSFYLQTSGSTIRGFAIGNFENTGLTIAGNNNKIECNHIGLGADGVSPMPNSLGGISVGSTFRSYENNVIGGTESHAQRNVISGNEYRAVSTAGANVIANNYIGTTADGLSPLANAGIGIWVETAREQTEGVTIGGTDTSATNVISGNEEDGIFFNSNVAGADLNQTNHLLGNLIGVGVDGTTAIPNGRHGIQIGGATDIRIGGISSGEANVIAYNAFSGIATQPSGSTKNSFRGNQIHSNGGLGIDLGFNDEDTNDELDVDEGPNGLQNYPLLTTVSTDGQIGGSLNSAPDQAYELDFYANASCDDSGHGEGERYLGSTTVNTDGSGNATFAIALDDIALAGVTIGNTEVVAATATDPNGNTSEFSPCAATSSAPQEPTVEYITDCRVQSASEPQPSPVTPEPTLEAPGTTPVPPTPVPGTSETTDTIFLPMITNIGNPEQSNPDGFNSSGNRTHAAATTDNPLTDGGAVIGLDGVAVGAISGTLTTTLTISINAASAPTETLWANPQVHGNYYHIAADKNVFMCNPEKGFVLGLPVPDGVETENLAIARVTDGLQKWVPIMGFYDPESRLMLVHRAAVTTEGEVFVLIENLGFSSVPLSPISKKPVSAAQHDDAGNRFEVWCIDNVGDISRCGEGALIETFLALLYTEFNDMEFVDPLIQHPSSELGSFGRVVDESTYVAMLWLDVLDCGESDDRVLAHGTNDYFPLDKLILFCFNDINETALTNDQMREIRHAYFHAVQFGGEYVAPEYVFNRHNGWLLESTATAAEISTPSEMKSQNELFRFDVRNELNPPGYLTRLDIINAFQAQDFWVYHGRSTEQGLGMFKSLFAEHGASFEAAVDWVGGLDKFQEIYINWTQNQIMFEDEILLNDDDTGEVCTKPIDPGTPAYVTSIDPFVSFSKEIEPLSTHLIEVQTSFLPAGLGIAPLPSGRQTENLHYKVYLDGQPDCANKPENRGENGQATRWFTQEAGAQAYYDANQPTIYILVSNISTETTETYGIWYE